jgi:hypothetical protein
VSSSEEGGRSSVALGTEKGDRNYANITAVPTWSPKVYNSYGLGKE